MELERHNYCTASSENRREITVRMLRNILAKKGVWKTFDNFKNHKNMMWVTLIDREITTNSSYSCPFFIEHPTCKHGLGMLIKLKLCDVPELPKDVLLGHKRKRGRPAYAKKALLVK